MLVGNSYFLLALASLLINSTLVKGAFGSLVCLLSENKSSTLHGHNRGAATATFRKRTHLRCCLLPWLVFGQCLLINDVELASYKASLNEWNGSKCQSIVIVLCCNSLSNGVLMTNIKCLYKTNALYLSTPLR